MGKGKNAKKEREKVVKAAGPDVTDGVQATDTAEFDIDPADFIDPAEFDYRRRPSA